jgi:hypothetical protein
MRWDARHYSGHHTQRILEFAEQPVLTVPPRRENRVKVTPGIREVQVKISPRRGTRTVSAGTYFPPVFLLRVIGRLRGYRELHDGMSSGGGRHAWFTRAPGLLKLRVVRAYRSILRTNHGYQSPRRARADPKLLP